MNAKDYIESSKRPAHLPYIARYAFIGAQPHFNSTLKHLATTCEEEKWTEKQEFDILKNYVYHTFVKCVEDGLILIDDDHESSCFNTGLMTQNGYDVIGLFEKNERYTEGGNVQYWRLVGFFPESAKRFREKFDSKPNMVEYFTDYNVLQFDVEKEVYINYDHIVDENTRRLPSALSTLDRASQVMLIDAAKNVAKKKIKRNHRLVVPMWSPKQQEIQYLIPFKIFNDTVPVVARLEGNAYNIVTVLEKHMAYKNARLLMKPETNWLL